MLLPTDCHLPCLTSTKPGKRPSRASTSLPPEYVYVAGASFGTDACYKRTIESFDEPPSLALPRLDLLVSTSPGLQKTARNFIDLCTDSRKLSSKQSIKGSKPPLRYAGTRVFRVERDFCCQGGDVTMNDGSGGESICQLLVWYRQDG